MSKRIDFEKLNNTRDLGGMETGDGKKIKPGKLIRSGNLFSASESDQKKLAGLADTFVDFRSVNECRERPELVLPGVTNRHIPILEEAKAGVTRDEASYEEVRRTMLDDSEIARRYMVRVYSGFAVSPYSRSQYERFVRILLENHDRAVLWHCTAGKDRAGFGTVIVQELLGVRREDIMEDYLMTNVFLEKDIDGIVADIRKRSGTLTRDGEISLRYMFAAWRDYLEGTYSKIDEIYGGFDGYIRDGLHISDAERETLRSMYLE